MSIDDHCQFCGAIDSWRHSLVECTSARCVSALLDDELAEQIVEIREPSAKHWLFRMLESLSHANFVKLSVTLWAIWTARRKATHEGIFQSPMSTHMFVQCFISELECITPLQAASVARAGQLPAASTCSWKPPPADHIKIYVDGGLYPSGEVGAAAAVCRGSDGSYLGSLVIVFPGVKDPATLEALACREARALAEDLLLSRVIIACDCKTIVEYIKGGSGGSNMSIIKEFIVRSSSFDSCSVIFEGRASNFEAHSLAKHSSLLD